MSNLAFTALWLSALTVAMTASSYFSYRQNITQDKIWFFLTWAIGVIPMWAIVSRYSKNLVADAVLYDTAIALVYYVALLFFTDGYASLRWWQVLGFFLAILGPILVRIK